MSTDYYMLCKQCKKYVSPVASGSIAYGNKLWRGKEELDALSDFLFEHENHKLVFLSEHHPELDKLFGDEK